MERFNFDREYVEALRANDLRIQQHFATYFRELLLIKLRRRVPSAEIANDLAQETFVRVLTTLRAEGLRSPGSLGAFVDSVCNNVLLEYYRQGKRTAELGENAVEPIDERDNPEDVFVTRQRQKLVAVVLAEMPVRDRELLRKVFLEEEDRDVVCRQYGVDREHLRVLLHRAKNRFRAVMEGSKRRAAAGD